MLSKGHLLDHSDVPCYIWLTRFLHAGIIFLELNMETYICSIQVSTADEGLPVWVKRESGGNPERCRHCVPERRAYTLGNREGRGRNEGSQETCLRAE